MQLRNMTLYSIFIRNFGGTFRAAEADLARIRALGVDAIWLLPIHPIGTEKRKGSLGSPYAISDYRKVNPEFGTLADFISLCDAAHNLGMKVLIDVVYHHTSPDSALKKAHPEYFYRKPDGSFGNHVGEWSDIIDFDFSAPGLWDELIDTLCYWAQWVDGFRCDVASMVPPDFWKAARRRVETVRKGCIWLAESVEHGFIRYNRAQGLTALSDSELYEAFDICYDYDVYPDYIDYLEGRIPLERYVDALVRQESTYRADYVKLRFTENHDRARTAALLPDPAARENHLCWMFFQKGMPLLYCGQEWAAAHTPSLFDPDPIARTGEPVYAGLFQKLIALKKDPIFFDGVYELEARENDVIVASWTKGERRLLGVFSMKGKPASVAVPLPDGCFADLLRETPVSVQNGTVHTDGAPIVIKID